MIVTLTEGRSSHGNITESNLLRYFSQRFDLRSLIAWNFECIIFEGAKFGGFREFFMVSD